MHGEEKREKKEKKERERKKKFKKKRRNRNSLYIFFERKGLLVGTTVWERECWYFCN